MTRLRDVGEDELIRRLIRHTPLPPEPSEGPGDDCAVLPTRRGPLGLLKTDAMVEGIHYLPSAPPRAIGWKATARVISDFAAMGGQPDRFLVTIALHPDHPTRWIEEVYQGIGRCLRTFGGQLAGGETTRLPAGSATVISIAATGSVPRNHLITRSGGNPGDILFVTGRLGGSLAGRHLKFTPRTREAAWLARFAKPTAMMDLSDGLAMDLPRLARASRCGASLDLPSLPLHRGCTTHKALTDGEDFELLFSTRPRTAARLPDLWKSTFPQLPLTRIGSLTHPDSGDSFSGGWDHFRNPRP